MSDIDIQLREQPDGYGLSGTARRGDAVVQVDILPPAYLWAGDFKLHDQKLDPRMWQVFAGGEPIARIEREEDVGAALVPLLARR
jgi:hypothetical protein